MNSAEIQLVLAKNSSKWQVKPPPASSDTIDQLISQVPFKFPESYISLLAFSNGPEGSLGIRPGWFSLWEVEDIIESNKGYCVDEYIPGFFGFGSNGGGELFAFKISGEELCGVYTIPFCPLDENDAVLIADNFDSFILAMGIDSERQ
jgi:hypothetical protein